MKNVFILAACMSFTAASYSQNVGIGTTTPATPLHIKSTTSTNPLIIDGNGPKSYSTIAESGASLGYFGSFAGNDDDIDFGTGFGNAGTLHLTTLAIPRISIDNTGKVGIGITTPETILHIAETNTSTDGIDGVFINIQNTTTLAALGSLTGIRFRMDGVGTPVNSRYKGGIFFEKTGSWGVGSLHFVNNSSSNNNSVTIADAKMTVASNGYVGIGTTDPTIGRLQIEGPLSGDLLHVKTPGNTGLSMSVVSSYPTLGFNMMLNSGYKFIGNGYGGMFQHSPFTGDLNYYSASASGTAGNSMSFLPSFFTLDAAGRLGLSTSAPTAKLHVNGTMVIGSSSISPATGYSLSIDGKIICEEARVQISGSWPDYVFHNDYKLRSIDELEKQIKELKHLPDMPPAAEVKSEGFDLGNMNKKLLEKVEELTLYIIDLNKENKLLAERISRLEKK